MIPTIPRYAGVILIATDGAVLLQQRDLKVNIQNPGLISFFGGAVEANEEPIQAAIRELREELNLDVTPDSLKFFGQYNKSLEVHGMDRHCYIYRLENVDSDQLVQTEGTDIIRLQSATDMPSLNLSLLAREVLTDYFQTN